MPYKNLSHAEFNFHPTQIILVPQGSYATVADEELKFLAVNVVECIALIIRHPIKKISALFHVDLKTTPAVLEKAIKAIFEQAEFFQLDVYILGGYYDAKHSNSYQIVLRNYELVENCLQSLKLCNFIERRPIPYAGKSLTENLIINSAKAIYQKFSLSITNQILNYRKSGKEFILQPEHLTYRQLFARNHFALDTFIFAYRFVFFSEHRGNMHETPLFNYNDLNVIFTEQQISILSEFRNQMLYKMFDLNTLATIKPNESLVSKVMFLVGSHAIAVRFATRVIGNVFNQAGISISFIEKTQAINLIARAILSSPFGYKLFAIENDINESQKFVNQMIAHINTAFFNERNSVIYKKNATQMIRESLNPRNFIHASCCVPLGINFEKFSFESIRTIIMNLNEKHE